MDDILVKDYDHLSRLVELLDQKEYIAFDVETTGLDYVDDEVIGVALAIEGSSWYIDFPTLQEQDVTPAHIWTALLPILDLNRHILIGHSSAFDLYHVRKALRQYTTDGEQKCLGGCLNFWDTMQMAVLLDENLIGVRVPIEDADGIVENVGALSLKALATIYLGRHPRLWQENFQEWALDVKVSYACADARNTYDLADMFTERLEEKGLLDYYIRVFAPQVFITEHLERVGIHVNRGALEEKQKELNTRIGELEEQIRDIVSSTAGVAVQYKYGLRPPWTKDAFVAWAEQEHIALPLTDKGNVSVTAKILEQLAEEHPNEFDWNEVRESIEEPFNINSRAQLGDYLTRMGCRLPVTPSGQYSTTEDSLKAAANSWPELDIWGPLFEIYKLTKVRGTYVDGVLDILWPETGDAHPEWSSTSTTSGRFTASTSDKNSALVHKRGPALQTIPNPERVPPELQELGINPREWYVARPGHKLLIGDFEQAEVRVAALVSGCPVLRRAILRGGDIHVSNAKELFGAAWEEADEHERKRMRTQAKGGTFAALYGAGAWTVSKQQNITFQAAQDFLDLFYQTFHGLRRWKKREEKQVLAKGYSKTYGGRYRTPVLIAKPPKVTARRDEDFALWQKQRLEEALWRAELDAAFRKSKHLDPETATKQERESRALRQCINHIVQGTVGEFIASPAWAAIREGYSLVLQMHDELVLEVKDDPAIIEAAKSFMEERMNFTVGGVPFTCKVVVGDSWAAGKEA